MSILTHNKLQVFLLQFFNLVLFGSLQFKKVVNILLLLVMQKSDWLEQ